MNKLYSKAQLANISHEAEITAHFDYKLSAGGRARIKIKGVNFRLKEAAEQG